MKLHAAEKLDLNQARIRLDKSVEWVDTVLRRLAHILPGQRLSILEIGAAQGRTLIGLARLGHEAYGVEPYEPAIKIAKQLAQESGVTIDLRKGVAEALPFATDQFDLVLAFEVMEHVEDLNKSLYEIARVLRPGGLFWFSSASSMCPIQNEIKGFPLFGWYPDNLKIRIMTWAKIKHPELVGYTNHPALHWWTPFNARRRLKAAGFVKVWDRWDLRLPSENHGFLAVMIRLAKKSYLLRIVGDVISSGCSYAAQKGVAEPAENGS